MVDIEYYMEEMEPVWQKIFFIGSVVLLLLLIPTTALGYFAEKSIPGQPLYSMKRGIEAGILALESLTPYGKSNYLLSLADTRVAETSTLIENAKVSGDFGSTLNYSDSALTDIVSSVKEAQVSIQKISDPVKKQEAQQNLANAVQKYQSNLQRIIVVIRTPTTTSVMLKSNVTSTPTLTPTSSPTAGDTSQPTPTPTVTNDVATSQNTLTQQIQQTQNDLQQIQSQINTPPNTVPPTATPTSLPTSVLSPTPTLTPTPTLSPFKRDHGNSPQGGDN